MTNLSNFLCYCLTQLSFKQTFWKLGGKWPQIILTLPQAMYILDLMSTHFILSHLKKKKKKGFAYLFQNRTAFKSLNNAGTEPSNLLSGKWKTEERYENKYEKQSSHYREKPKGIFMISKIYCKLVMAFFGFQSFIQWCFHFVFIIWSMTCFVQHLSLLQHFHFLFPP